MADGIALSQQNNLNAQGWVWIPYETGGVLKVRHTNGYAIQINWNPLSVTHIETNTLSAALYPNPVTSGQVTLTYTLSHAQNAVIEICDVSGQQLKAVSLQAQAGVNNQLLNVDGLAAGIYFVKLGTTEGNFLNKIIVCRK